jgi:hypothetical protein
VGFDENNYQGSGPGGGHSQAAQVQFLVDGTSVLTVDAASSEYYVFKGFTPGLALAPGPHTIVVRATYGSNPGPAATIDSVAATITVEAPPAYAQTISLSADASLATAATWVGTAGARVRVNGNGHAIVDPGSTTAVTWQYVDFYDLGSRTDTSTNGIDVTTSGNVTVQNCRFDYTNPVQFTASGASIVNVTGNLWRSNVREPIGQGPTAVGGSYPSVLFRGKASGPNVFAGNNVGAGWVDWQDVANWTVGGDTDADSNVAIGPRVGFFVDFQGGQSDSVSIRHNYTHHVYYGGWSQGSNYELGGIPTLTAEHNVVVGSSWTVRGVGGEFRYNLVVNGGEDWMWVEPNAFVHHNLFVGGDLNRSGVYNTYDFTGIRILNNTFDGMSGPIEFNAIGSTGGETLTSNAFINLPASASHNPVEIHDGTLTADYNLFSNCKSPAYSDGRTPTHDVDQDPAFASPSTHTYEFHESAIWNRALSVHDVLAAYRSMYTPTAGSSAIDRGDTGTFGAGNDIGAIGAGAPNAADLFAK